MKTTTYTNFVVPKIIQYNDTVEEQLKRCDEFLSSIPKATEKEFEEYNRLRHSLVNCFQMVENLAVNCKTDAILYPDFAPLSFTFSAGGLFGGIIFHGPADGYGSGSAPTYSVCLEKTHGWSMHT